MPLLEETAGLPAWRIGTEFLGEPAIATVVSAARGRGRPAQAT